VLRLDQLPVRHPARITSIDWARLPEAQARRMRELGFDEGVGIETLHYGPVRRDPIALRVGRMTVAIRRAQAEAIRVAEAAAAE
jgi:ferrous iron transport protein A